MHVLDATAPTAVEYLPATQSVHAALPVAPLYFPETHLVHVPPSCPDDPALQMHAIEAELPAGAFEFAGHEVQVSEERAPNAVENVSCGHLLHMSSELAAHEAEYVPGPHLMQSESAAAPTDAEYLPATQSVHVSDPAAVLNFPATHCVHDPPLDPDEPASQVHAVKAELPAGELE